VPVGVVTLGGLSKQQLQQISGYASVCQALLSAAGMQ
jgi:hypothetical protein